MAKATSTVYAIAVSLSEQDKKALEQVDSRPVPLAEKLSGMATQLLQDLAGGGQMIEPAWADRIHTAIGTTDPGKIVEKIEASAKRRGEATVVTWVVDPTQIQYYQGLADNAGVSLDHELKSIMDFAYLQGWLGSGAPEVFKILLTREQFSWLQQRIGKDVPTGEDVMDLCQGNAPPAIPFNDDGADDLVMDSISGVSA